MDESFFGNYKLLGFFQVAVFSPSPTTNYLNITLRNVVKVCLGIHSAIFFFFGKLMNQLHMFFFFFCFEFLGTRLKQSRSFSLYSRDVFLFP